MRVNAVFVGLLAAEPGRHEAFLDWHEQDHRPENHGRIEHIYHSARFVASPRSIGAREQSASAPFDDAGHYLMTYWSSASPARLLDDMTVLREQLESLGRCAPINRDFRAVWRDRTQLVAGAASRYHPASADAAPFAPHDAIVLTLGRHGDDGGAWARWYGSTGVWEVLEDERFTASFTLRPTADAALFVHLHYALGDPIDAQRAVAMVMQPGPEILYRGSYVPQHAGQPRFFT